MSTAISQSTVTSHDVVWFSLMYVILGFIALRIRLWDPQDWPLFMKRAVAGSMDYQTSPPGSSPWSACGHRRRRRWWGGRIRESANRNGNRIGRDGGDGATWLEMVDQTARGGHTDLTNGVEGSSSKAASSVTVPKTVHHSHSTTSMAGGLHIVGDEEQGMNETAGRHISTTTTEGEPPPPPIRKMRKSGLLLVSLAGLLLILLWPIFMIWMIIWWFIYSGWAVHYIYISTRRARAVARAHSVTTAATVDGQQYMYARMTRPDSAILVTTERTTTREQLNRERANLSSQASASGQPVAAVFNEDREDNMASHSITITADPDRGIPHVTKHDNGGNSRTAAAAEFNSFYPQIGKHSRRIRTFLENESTMPDPKRCRAALLWAERKRRDIPDFAAGLVGSLPSPPPLPSQSGIRTHETTSSGGNGSGGGIDTNPGDTPFEGSQGERRSSNETNMNSRTATTGIPSSRIPTRRSSFQQQEHIYARLSQQNSRDYGRNYNTNYSSSRRIRRQSRMIYSQHIWQTSSQHPITNEEETGVAGAVELRSLTPSTLANLRMPSSSSHGDSASAGTSGSKRGEIDMRSGSGPKQEAVQVGIIPRLRRAGDTILASSSRGTQTTTTGATQPAVKDQQKQQQQQQSAIYRPGSQKIVTLVEGTVHEYEGVVPSRGQTQVSSSTGTGTPGRPPTPDRRSSIRNVRGLFTIQEGENDHLDEQGK